MHVSKALVHPTCDGKNTTRGRACRCPPRALSLGDVDLSQEVVKLAFDRSIGAGTVCNAAASIVRVFPMHEATTRASLQHGPASESEGEFTWIAPARDIM